jgi:hypothetical protein
LRCMQELFEELFFEIRRASPATAALLRPGLPPNVVKEKLAEVPFQISTDAVALYSWRDGAAPGFELLPGGYFITLDKALLDFELIHKVNQLASVLVALQNNASSKARQNPMYRFCTRCLLLMLFATSVTFEINKLQQIQNLSTMWFESMPGSHYSKFGLQA